MGDGDLFLTAVRAELASVGARLVKTVRQMGPADLSWRPGEGTNSAANLVLHICGNAGQRILANIGGAPDTRDRDAEFGSREPLTAEDLVRRIEDTFAAVDRVLAALPSSRLQETQPFRDGRVSHLEALLSCARHYGEHLGQIIYIAKQRLGAAWEGLGA